MKINVLALVFGLLLGTAVPLDAQTNLNVYTLRSMDKLKFRIEEDPEKGEMQTVQVTSQGEAQFEVSAKSDLYINIKVTGKTLEQVRQELKQKLDTEYYHDATLSLHMDEASPRMGKALFIGEGAMKGFVALPPGEKLTVTEALFQKGGPNEFAKLKRVIVMRQDPATGKAFPIQVNVEEILRTGDRTKDVVLQDGDQVTVNTGFNWSFK